MKASKMDQRRYYRGVPMIGYDLIKELVLATIVIGLVVVGLSAVMSSPDEPSVTIKSWSIADPVDFVTTAAAELGGTSDTANYGPPYTDTTGAAQAIGPFVPQQWAGDSLHLDTAQEFVVGPLTSVGTGDTALTTALSTWSAATSDQQQTWISNYTDAVANVTPESNGTITVPTGDYGPVSDLMAAELEIAQNGTLDGLLLTSPGRFFQTNYTAPLLFMGDGGYLGSLADAQHLQGDQWGMMNETGQYPGQTWLWLFTFWYQIPPFNTADNADLLVVLLMGFLTLLLALVPFIPILRDIPRWIPIHRLIWRRSVYIPQEQNK
jgi:hypothetical protein